MTSRHLNRAVQGSYSAMIASAILSPSRDVVPNRPISSSDFAQTANERARARDGDTIAPNVIVAEYVTTERFHAANVARKFRSCCFLSGWYIRRTVAARAGGKRGFQNSLCKRYTGAGSACSRR